ncbi:hydroxyethylthiazole kinase [Aestuariimicrobium sp. p3-SID1156]|uniref:hydroxyethylthiazole kinase n=1 Tax=Aestuariimicrobium sp. p3-SID1156 TaxID=2916038 RepID=UPI00223B0308|nr:hydroxyethylthiazole kinase [Aestuariimicrobium sp. p3-SID1156]MCT1458217.1 hydroxyethylthiazole kinase [Aestuariimicrobium sp. p3-SID1156]
MSAPAVTVDQLARAHQAVLDHTPLVQCITNIVVANVTANVLLAAGASPAMCDTITEAATFAEVASGVLINLGSPYLETIEAMRLAAPAARAAGTPWVLDPIAAGGLPVRTAVARDLLAHKPTIIRGNASEISGLAGGAGGRGVDATDSPEAVLDVAKELARSTGAVVAVSGAVDHLTDGEQVVRIANGDELMTKVTGVGCSLGALMAAYASEAEPLVAAAAATAVLCVAADAAVEKCAGPGSFAMHLIDELHALTPEQLAARVKLS